MKCFINKDNPLIHEYFPRIIQCTRLVIAGSLSGNLSIEARTTFNGVQRNSTYQDIQNVVYNYYDNNPPEISIFYILEETMKESKQKTTKKSKKKGTRLIFRGADL